MFFLETVQEERPDLVACIMTQLPLKVGLKEWGTEAHKAAHTEMKQLHFRDTFKPLHWHELSHTEKQTVLKSHMFLKEKRCGKIKGRGCVDGRKQREWTAKSESTSPTITTNAVFLTAVIEALEGRDVAIFDVAGAFMQADMDEVVHVRFTGTMVDMLLEIDEEMYEQRVCFGRSCPRSCKSGASHPTLTTHVSSTR